LEPIVLGPLAASVHAGGWQGGAASSRSLRLGRSYDRHPLRHLRPAWGLPRRQGWRRPEAENAADVDHEMNRIRMSRWIEIQNMTKL
jgi:hypothetical protein